MLRKSKPTEMEQQKFIEALNLNHTCLDGVCCRVHSAIGSRKNPPTCTVYLSHELFCNCNYITHEMIRSVSAFPDEPVERFDYGRAFCIPECRERINPLAFVL